LFYRRLPRFEYMKPKTLDEALALLAEYKEGAKILAGGTDLIPQLKRRTVSTPRYLVDLKGLAGLDHVTASQQTGLKIGPLATIRTIAESPPVKQHYSSLVQAALSMASPQIRNRGTFVGNICSAIPSADSVPALLALGASVKVKGLKGERLVPLDRFFTGPRATALEADEMVVELSVPPIAADSRGVYLKLSPRHSMDLAIVGVAVQGICVDGVCKDIRIALGAVAPTPVRALLAETILQSRKITLEIIDEAANNAVTQCSPIDDHRASQEYRCDMIYAMTRRALRQVLQSPEDRK
jgi:CO/xanthine dehydrogenase FAD-binding subunit